MARGYKTGGRKPGVRNKSSIAKQVLAEAGVRDALAAGIMPKDLLLLVMRKGPGWEQVTDRQIDAAKAVLPYVNPRLNSTYISATVSGDGLTWEQRLDELARGPLELDGHAEPVED